MLRIGCHLSCTRGYFHMGRQAATIGANTFQFFTRNPRGGKARKLDMDDILHYLVYARGQGIEKILAHAPYTLNPCAKDNGLREFAFVAMQDDLRRLEHIPGAMYNFHPGSHVSQGAEEGIRLIAEHLNRLLEEEFQTTVLLETMAGKGSEVGRSFEELQAIIEKVEKKDKLGVCFDTCHVFDGGYDIVNRLDEVLHEFDEVIGLDRLKAVHLNDSMNQCGSHKDRHAKIGEGNIGLEAMERIINHKDLRDLPFYLETPNEIEGYQEEILLLKSLYKAD